MTSRPSPTERGSGGEDPTPIRRTVIGIDFHPPSLEAARWTIRHLAPDAWHDLLYIGPLPDLPGPLRALAGRREEMRVAARQEARRRLEALAAEEAPERAAAHVREGRPSAEVVRFAAEAGADLIVMGREGPRRGLEALLGSTAELTLAGARIPLLLARPRDDSPPRRILAAIDEAPVTRTILAWAGSLSRRFDAPLTVMHVVDRTALLGELGGYPAPDALGQLEEEGVAAMEAWLRRTIGEAGLGEERATSRVCAGDPAYEVITEAARGGIDLVVLGTKGGDVARTTLVGRIINKVVRSAPCSVLVVPAR